MTAQSGETTRLPRLAAQLLLVGLVTCLAVEPVHADIVLHDGGVNKDRDAGWLVKEHTGSAPALILSSDVLSGPTRVLSSNATVEQCEGAPITLAIDTKLNEIEDDVFSYELDSALRSLDILITLLPCADSPISAAALARMSFLRGATLLDLVDPLAEKAMAESLAFVPAYRGERGFPRAHKEMLDTARRRMETLPDGRLFIWAGPGGGGVFVDGTLRYQEDTAGVPVRPGLHLVQVLKDGILKGMWVRIRSRFSAVVYPGAGRAVWADGGRSPGGEQAMSVMLRTEFRGQQGDIHILRYRGRLVAASTWPAFGGAPTNWQLKGHDANRRKKKREDKTGKTGAEVVASASTPQAVPAQTPSAAESPAAGRPAAGQKAATEPKAAAAEAQQTGKSQPADGAAGDRSKATAKTNTAVPGKPYEKRRFRVVLGGGYHYADPFNYALIAFDISYQFFGPLHAALFARPSLGAIADFPVVEGGETVRGPLSFVPFGLGIGVQKPGRFSPYARIVGQYSHNRDGLSEAEHLGGVMIQGGLDFMPKPALPLIVRVQAEAGFLGAHFNARVWGGVGVNL